MVRCYTIVQAQGNALNCTRRGLQAEGAERPEDGVTG